MSVEVTAAPAVRENLTAGHHLLHDRGDLTAARSRFAAAYTAAERTGDAPAMAQAALGFAGIWVHEHRDATVERLEARLRHALAGLDPDDPLALRIRIRLAAEADYRAGRPDRILALLDEARRGGDPVARVEALSLALHCLLGPEHGPLRAALARELVAQSVHTGRRIDLLIGLAWQTADAFLRGEPHAERQLARLRAGLADGGHLAIGYIVAGMDVMLAVRAGRFEDAERMAHECARAGAAAGDWAAAARLGAHLLAIRWFQGRLAETVPQLSRLLHLPTLSAVDNSFAAVLAVAAADAGDRLTAAGLLARLAGADLADLPRSSSWLVTMTGIVEAAHRLGDTAVAARAYALLLPHADLPVVGGLGVVCLGSVHHLLGLASLTTGDPGTAATHFAAAIRRGLALGHWPAVVMARQRRAEALLHRGERAAATEELAAARTAAASAGIALPLPVGALDPGTAPATCVRDGAQWRVGHGGRIACVGHSVGLLHLAVLLANPGAEIPCAELTAGVSGLERLTLSGQEVLDATATRQYRTRLRDLQADLTRAETRGDRGHAERLRAERDWLARELAAATGLGGRERRFTDHDERARLAVGKAIRRALNRIAETDPAIGEHLRGHVSTGVRCVYRP